MTDTIMLGKSQRLIVEKPSWCKGVLGCHLEQINKNGHWNGRGFFLLTSTVLAELTKIMEAKE